MKKEKEIVEEIIINEESDFADLEASDFELSGDDFDEELQENKSSSLLDIVSDKLDKDCSDGSDMEEDSNNQDFNIEKPKDKDKEEDDMEKLEIVTPDSNKINPQFGRKASVGG